MLPLLPAEHHQSSLQLGWSAILFLLMLPLTIHWYKDTTGDRKLFGVKQQHLPKDLLKFVFHELSFFIKVFCWWCRNTGLCDLWKRPGSSSRGCCQGDKGLFSPYPPQELSCSPLTMPLLTCTICTTLHKVSNSCYAHDKCVQWTVDVYLCILLWAYHSIMIQTLPIVHFVIAWRSLPLTILLFFLDKCIYPLEV